MKRSNKEKTKRSAPRDLFAELNESMEALSEVRQGQRTLRTHTVEILSKLNSKQRENSHPRTKTNAR
jgi:hypothetical protein